MAKSLTYIPGLRVDHVVGRGSQLTDLEDLVAHSSAPVLISGIGGIGKTLMATWYVQRHAPGYDHVAWLYQITDLESAFTDNEQLAHSLGLKFGQETPEEQFSILLESLRGLPGDNLLVIDNVDEQVTKWAIRNEFPSSGWKIILTSRSRPDPFEVLELTHLSPEEARKLFEKDFPGNGDLDALLQFIDYHPLTIELVAKTLNKRRGRVSIGALFTLLQDRQLGADEIQRRIPVMHQEELRDDRYVKLYSHLVNTFSFQNLDDTELSLLKHIAILPSEPQPSWRFIEWLNMKEDRMEKYEDGLDRLIEGGWLEINGSGMGETVYLHRMIKLLMLTEHPPLMGEVAGLIVSVMDLIDFQRGNVDPWEYFRFAPYAQSILDGIPDLPYKDCGLGNLLGLLYDRMGKYELAETTLRKEVEGRLHLLGEEGLRPAITKSNLASTLLNLDRYYEAAELLESSIRVIKAYPKEKEHLLFPIANLSLAYMELGRLGPALELGEEALQMSLESCEKDDPHIGVLQNNLARVKSEMGDWTGAKTLLEHSLAQSLRLFGPESLEVAENRVQLASSYRDRGLFREAVELLELAVRTFAREYGEDHFHLEYPLSQLAVVLGDMGHYQEELALLQRCQRILEENPSGKRSLLALNFSNQGLTFLNLNQKDQGVRMIEKSMEILETGPEDLLVDGTLVLGNLGFAYSELGEFEIAKTYLMSALESEIFLYGNGHPVSAGTMGNLAGMYRKMDQLEKALDWMEKSYKILEANYKEINPDYALSMGNLAILYKETGQVEKGQTLALEAYNAMCSFHGEDHPNIKALIFSFVGFLGEGTSPP